MNPNTDSIMGTSSTGIDELTNSLEERILEISMSFDEMDKTMLEMQTCVKDDASALIKNTYENISLYFTTVKNNLEIYKGDFITVKNNHEGFDKSFQTSDVVQVNDEGGDYDGVS